MLYLVFPSLSRTNVHYEVNAEKRDYCSKPPGFADFAFEWNDLGHAGVKHTPSTLVLIKDCADYMASLATHLVKDVSVLDAGSMHFLSPDMPDAQRVLWLNKLGENYRRIGKGSDSGTRRYYNTVDMKISSDPEKRHDKRYRELTADCHGTPFVLNSCIQSHFSAFEIIAVYVGVTTILQDHANKPFELAFDDWGQIRNAFESLKLVVDAYKRLERAKTCLSCYRHNYVDHPVEARA